jgi:hypothetical protein
MRRFLVMALLIAGVGGFVGCDKKPTTSSSTGVSSSASDPNSAVGVSGNGGKAPVLGGGPQAK